MSTGQVIARLHAIDHQLPHNDGVRWFNALYLQVTKRVHDLLQHGGFEDAVFMQRLDAIFADLYFDALDRGTRPAWRPLLDARGDTQIEPGRFMLAGVNAHVNYDLPIALVEACRELGGELAEETPRHRDFQRIDGILSDVERDMHHQLHTDAVKEVLALWGVIRARDRAWRAAITLAELHGDPDRHDRYLRQLASMVADWGDLLLHMLG